MHFFKFNLIEQRLDVAAQLAALLSSHSLVNEMFMV